MHRRRLLLPVSTIALLAGHHLLSGCAIDLGAGRASGNDLTGGGGESPTDCVATFTWWQKDAYLNSPGRHDPLWPPHTTTELAVSCGGKVVGTASMTNHGTPLGTTNDAGVPILTDTNQATVHGSQAELLSLLGTYQACACDPATPGGPGTQFLSAQPPSPVMGQVLTTLGGYIQQNVQCPGTPTADQIATMLEGGDFEGAGAALVSCSWKDGASFEAGLEQAASTVSGELASVLAGYHVCNNDAMLQANLFSTFQETGSIAACDPTATVCQGPQFFYDPKSAGGGVSGGGASDGGASGSSDGGAPGWSDGGASGWDGGAGFDGSYGDYDASFAWDGGGAGD